MSPVRTTMIGPFDADPYPWPFDGPVAGERTALVVCGAHRVWRDRSHRIDEVRSVLAQVADALRAAGGTVVALRHCAPARGRRPSLLTEGCGAGATLVADELGEPTEVVDAAGLNGFHGSRLDELLRLTGRDHLVFGGFGAEATVDSTLRAANDRGYECLVLTDACAPLDLDTGPRALASVTMSGGIFGAIAPSSALLAALTAAPAAAPHSALSPLSPLEA